MLNQERVQASERPAEEQVIPSNWWVRKFIKGLIRILAAVLLKLKFEGLENFPKTGGVIMATNHMSQADTAILLLNPVRDDQAALVADKYKKHPLISIIVKSQPHFWIDRSRADFAALRGAIGYLKDGGTLGIAPEGTRSKSGALIEGKPGAVLLAVKAEVPIVAVSIAGTENFRKNVARFKRTAVTVRFSKPFYLPPLDPADRSGSLQRTTEEIMCQIAAQLPDRYHGVYAGHPRIQEIRQETGREA